MIYSIDSQRRIYRKQPFKKSTFITPGSSQDPLRTMEKNPLKNELKILQNCTTMKKLDYLKGKTSSTSKYANEQFTEQLHIPYSNIVSRVSSNGPTGKIQKNTP